MAFAHNRYPRNEKNPDELATPTPGSILNLGKGASGKPGVPLLRRNIVPFPAFSKLPSQPPGASSARRLVRGEPLKPLPSRSPPPAWQKASLRSA